MDDQGAGGSSRGRDTNPKRESSLPPALIQHLIAAPTVPHSPLIAPLVSPGWHNHPPRSRSQGYDLPLPSPSHLSQLTRGPCPVFPPLPNVQGVAFAVLALVVFPLLIPLSLFPISIEEQIADRRHHAVFIICLFSSTERRSPTTYSMNRFDDQQRHQHPPPQEQPQRQQVHHQPQPRQPARFSHLLSGPGYQGTAGASSSSQPRSPSRSQTLPSFPSELYSEGPSEIKPVYQGGSMAESPVIETQEAVPEQKKVQRSPGVKNEPGTSTEEGGSTSTGAGATTSTRRKPTTKVTVACDFCRGEHIGHCSTFTPQNLIELSIGISIRAVCCGFGSR